MCIRYAKLNMNQNLKKDTIIVDSSNLLHRAVWIAENVRNNVNPSYIFLTSIKKYVDMFQCKNVISVWDKRLVRGIKNYRRLAKTTEYKGTRDADKNEKVFKHEDLTTELLWSVGVKNMYPGILEADDVIYWLSKNTPGKKVVVSVDQDMLQLIDSNTDVYSPIKDVIITSENFKDQTGVEITNFIKFKSLVGDKSDNIPGVPRVGKKTAIKLIESHKTDDQLFEKLGEENTNLYSNNYKLIDLSEAPRQHPDDTQLYVEQYEKLQSHAPDFEKFKNMTAKLNMQAITNKIHVWKEAFTGEDLNNKLVSIVNRLNLDK